MGQEFWIKFISSSLMTLWLTFLTSIIRKYPGDWRNSSNVNSGPVWVCVESLRCIIIGLDIGKAISVVFLCIADIKSSVELKSVIWIALWDNLQSLIKHLRVIREKNSPNIPSTSPELDEMVNGGTLRTDTVSPFLGQKWRSSRDPCMRTDLHSKVATIIMTIEVIRGNVILSTTVLLMWQPTKNGCWASFIYSTAKLVTKDI